MSRHLALAEKACAFLTQATDPFHAVAAGIQKLQAAGFVPYENNSLQKGGKYYYVVHHSTLVAFAVGGAYEPGKGGFHIIGGHTDSPNLRVKPRSRKQGSGYVQLGVECYGGGLWHTWFDRDLSISGKVLVRQDSGKLRHEFVQLEDPIARVSTLCIHLQSADERQAFKVNKEDHTSPILGMPNVELEEELTKQVQGDAWRENHEPRLLQRIAEKLGVRVNQIADFDLSLYDTQPACIGGINKEFLYSGRLDNLATVFCALEAIVEHTEDVSSDKDIKLIACFDHEEYVGGRWRGL